VYFYIVDEHCLCEFITHMSLYHMRAVAQPHVNGDRLSKSCIVNRQYGLGNSKYMVILDPLPTGHVPRSMRSELLAFNMGNCNFEALYLRNGAK